MDITALKHMQQVTQVAYQQAQQELAAVKAEERRVRGELERLRVLASETRATAGQDMALASIGGDLLWQGWLSRSRASLNMTLARVLAVKEHHLKTVRKAYGKVLVSEELLQNAKDAAQKKRRDAALCEAIGMQVMGRGPQ